LIVQAVPVQETGSAMGFYQVVRYVGFSMGSALTASILAARATGNDQPTLSGYTTVLWTSGAICVAAAALAWFLPARPSQLAPTERLPAEELRLLEQTDGDGLIADSTPI
jgi:predicted MFS family arabinose efflux permease